MRIETFFIYLLTTSSLPAWAGFRDPGATSGDRGQELNPVTAVARVVSPGSFPTAQRSPASPLGATHGLPPIDRSPITASPGLPAATKIPVPTTQLGQHRPVTILRDSIAPIPVTTRNRGQLLDFARRSRALPLPSRTYADHPRSVEIAVRYAPAFRLVNHRPIRTPLHLSLASIAKIKDPPPLIQYENMVKRLDALFDGFYTRFPAGVQSLWELANEKSNPLPLQARDALFAGILSSRAGWETVAGNLLEESVSKKIDADDRYLGILWAELQAFHTTAHVDRVVAKVSPLKAKAANLSGDQANYAMARRVLAGRAQPLVSADAFTNRIAAQSFKERIEMIRALSHLRRPDGKKEWALAILQKIESEGSPELKEDARLALARALLQKGETQPALDLYRRTAKTSKNRLNVLAEQSYAEFKSGLFQDSLGKAVGLQSPYFQYGFSPDIHLVEILSRKALCDFGGAEAGIQRFKERYLAEMHTLEANLARKPGAMAYYEELISYHAKAAPMRHERYLLRLPAVMENQKILHEALNELSSIDQVGLRKYTSPRPARWDAFAESMRKTWARTANQLKSESAQTALAETTYMVNRLKQTFAQVELLGLDIATSATKNYNLQSALNFPARKLASVELERDQFHWPFEDEIWEDELDFLKMKNPSKCATH